MLNVIIIAHRAHNESPIEHILLRAFARIKRILGEGHFVIQRCRTESIDNKTYRGLSDNRYTPSSQYSIGQDTLGHWIFGTVLRTPKIIIFQRMLRVRQSARILAISLRKLLQINIRSIRLVFSVSQCILRISLRIFLQINAKFALRRVLIVNQIIVGASLILLAATLRIIVQIFVARVIVLFQIGIELVGFARVILLNALLRRSSRRILCDVSVVRELTRILDYFLGTTRR